MKVAHIRLPSVGFRSWSRFLAVSLQMTWVINPLVGCHYFPPGLQLTPHPLRGLLPILLLGEQSHDGVNSLRRWIKKLVAAIFLLPVWPLEPHGRAFLASKFDPISPLLGNRGSRIYFSFRGAYSDYLVVKTYQGTPYGGSLKIRDFQKKFGGTWTRCFEGVAVIRMAHKIFWAFRTKKTWPIFFIFFEFRPTGWAMPPQKMVQFLTFFKFSQKSTRHKLLKIQTLRRKVSHSQFSTVVQSWNWTCAWYNTHRLFFTQGTEGEHAA